MKREKVFMISLNSLRITVVKVFDNYLNISSCILPTPAYLPHYTYAA